ncbi:DEAD/DEAH box helicase [Actinomadura craniellae]|nr:DEAD/DEAH box helicase family protein [Actinomadura craniellae]
MANAFGLRDWQQECRERYHSRSGGTDGNFLVVATPGAGKTTFALTLVQDLISRGEIFNTIVVVPSAHLRRQWSEAASRMGIQLDHTFVNRNAVVSSDFDGVAVTYQAVATEPTLWRTLCSRKRTLVIFDEIHHAGEGDEQRWGPALKSAFEPAHRRLLLSGTPFRTDGTPIPFVEYHDRKAVPGYNYDYGMALADGGVVRPAVFPSMDGESKWRRAGDRAITSIALTDTDEQTVPPALRAALDPAGQWIPSVLREANNALTNARIDTHDAGGLVVAFDQDAARAYAQILEQITGEKPAIATSDDPTASQVIKSFTSSTSRWIVAVQMVAEGVDIPRLAVGVYASRVRTKMFFIQVVGRFVRMRGEEDETTARLFIPSVEPLLSHAREIEKTVDAVIADQEKRVREIQDSDGDTAAQTSLLPAFETVGSSEAVHHSTIANGEFVTPDEMNYAQTVMSRTGQPPRGMTVEYVALLLRTAGAQLPEQRKDSRVTEKPLADQKQEVRRLLQRKVGKYSITTGKPHEYIHAALNRHFGDIVKTAKMDTLMKRIQLIDTWQREAEA